MLPPWRAQPGTPVGRLLLLVLVLTGPLSACASRQPLPVETNPQPVEPATILCASEGKPSTATPKTVFEYLNARRVEYTQHQPYDGYPWVGAYTPSRSWPAAMIWDETLAQRAQAEAERLAAGGEPIGKRFRHQRAGIYGARTEDMWLRGLDTAEYEVAAKSMLAMHPEGRWHSSGNGTMRLAVLYQTGTGTFATKSRLGIGRACLASGEAWWVLKFGQ